MAEDLFGEVLLTVRNSVLYKTWNCIMLFTRQAMFVYGNNEAHSRIIVAVEKQ